MEKTIPIPPAPHISVLYNEIIHSLNPNTTGHYVDCTVGAGGHAWGILNSCSPEGKLLGLDVDPHALDLAAKRLAEYGERVVLKQASFSNLAENISLLGWKNVQGIVIDLGVSSMQIDTPDRGFSFLSEGPLDMRLNPNQKLTAADIVNNDSEEELADILWRYGDERLSRRIARIIVRARPIKTTTMLAETVISAIGRRPGHIHPATRTFQALRIAVNDELKALETTLPQAIEALCLGGRLAVISFHSLEDRIVKQYFRRESKDCICPAEQPICTCGHKAILNELSRRPIIPTDEEIKQNPRSRSARLRVVEKKMDLASYLH